MPKTREEQEIVGYRNMLSISYDSHDHISPKLSIILQFHRDLYKFGELETRGKYKSSDNIIEEIDTNGNTDFDHIVYASEYY